VDAVISRFSVAHFVNTANAFKNLRRSIRPGGRLVFVEWTSRAENEWMTFAEDVARRVLPDHFGHRHNGAEHATDFADPGRLRDILAQAEFETRTFDRITEGIWVGSTPADVLAWFSRLREGRILQMLEPAARGRLLSELERELAQRVRAEGVYLGGAAWLVESRVR
jgi:SAM-dependent methyltransferase